MNIFNIFVVRFRCFFMIDLKYCSTHQIPCSVMCIRTQFPARDGYRLIAESARCFSRWVTLDKLEILNKAAAIVMTFIIMYIHCWVKDTICWRIRIVISVIKYFIFKDMLSIVEWIMNASWGELEYWDFWACSSNWAIWHRILEKSVISWPNYSKLKTWFDEFHLRALVVVFYIFVCAPGIYIYMCIYMSCLAVCHKD